MQSDISTPSHVFTGSSEYILDSVKNIHWHLAPSLVSMSISPHHYLVCMSIAPCPPMKSPPPLFNLHEHSLLQLSSLPEDSPLPLFSGHEDSPMPLLVLELYAWHLHSSSLPWTIWHPIFFHSVSPFPLTLSQVAYIPFQVIVLTL